MLLLGCAAAGGRRVPPTAGPAPAGRARARASGGGGPPTEIARAPLGTLSVSKWRLDNGLEVVLLPDPQATAVSYTTWFRVGSRNEDAAAGETGLAHLFEHLMFTQTKNAPPNAFDTQMEAVGGSSNAMTYYDFTAYVDDVPPAEVATAVRLEADRMVNLDLRKKQVETERDVVAEERLSSVEDSVDGVLDELMYQQAFKKHPYRWPVIGLMKDIKAFTQANAVAFYRKYYAPNNAVIVVAGKIDEAAMLDLIADAYGALAPSRKLPSGDATPERAPAAEVRTTVTRPVPADRLVIGFPAPALGAARPRRLRGRERNPGRRAVVAPEPRSAGRPAMGVVRARRHRAHARSRPLRHLDPDDEGAYGGRGRAAGDGGCRRTWPPTHCPPPSLARRPRASRRSSGSSSLPATAAPRPSASSRSRPAGSSGCWSEAPNTRA